MNGGDWLEGEEGLEEMEVMGREGNEVVKMMGDVEGLNWIGRGREGGVFKYEGLGEYGLKM